MTKTEYIKTLRNEGFSDSEILDFAKSENFDLSIQDLDAFESDLSNEKTNEVSKEVETGKNEINDTEKLNRIYSDLIESTYQDSTMINISKLQKFQKVLESHKPNDASNDASNYFQDFDINEFNKSFDEKFEGV